jgi:transcriptional antiterminator RfaH
MEARSTSPPPMTLPTAWYLVQCKPRQDERAEENLSRQGYCCYRPLHQGERVVRGRRRTFVESLFPGYLFIQLAANANWAPLRSTFGVSRVVMFGGRPQPVPNTIIRQLQEQAVAPAIAPLLNRGERVRVVKGCFAELDGTFLTMDGDERVVLLLNLLNHQQQVRLPLASIAVH